VTDINSRIRFDVSITQLWKTFYISRCVRIMVL